jgi:hypothetical protein
MTKAERALYNWIDLYLHPAPGVAPNSLTLRVKAVDDGAAYDLPGTVLLRCAVHGAENTKVHGVAIHVDAFVPKTFADRLGLTVVPDCTMPQYDGERQLDQDLLIALEVAKFGVLTIDEPLVWVTMVGVTGEPYYDLGN